MDLDSRLKFNNVPGHIHCSMKSILDDLILKRGFKFKLRDFFYVDCGSTTEYRLFAYAYFYDGFGVCCCSYFDIVGEFDIKKNSLQWNANLSSFKSRKF